MLKRRGGTFEKITAFDPPPNPRCERHNRELDCFFIDYFHQESFAFEVWGSKEFQVVLYPPYKLM
jgi:hypothetical protein